MKIKRKRFIEEFCYSCNESSTECYNCKSLTIIDKTFEALKKKKEVPVVEVDWEKIPKWVQWIAMDKCGNWFGFKSKPYFDSEIKNVWYTLKKYIYVEIETTGKINWKKSLVKRPGGK